MDTLSMFRTANSARETLVGSFRWTSGTVTRNLFVALTQRLGPKAAAVLQSQVCLICNALPCRSLEQEAEPTEEEGLETAAFVESENAIEVESR